MAATDLPKIAVRPARRDEAEFIVAVCSLEHCRPFVNVPSVEAVRRGFETSDAETYIVEHGRRGVGMFRLSWLGEPLWLVELRLLVVGEPGKRYGAAAMGWIKRRAFAELGAHRLSLEVTADNLPARSLYERAGLREEGTWRDGFCVAPASYKDLIAYGMLEHEYPIPLEA